MHETHFPRWTVGRNFQGRAFRASYGDRKKKSGAPTGPQRAARPLHALLRRQVVFAVTVCAVQH